MNFGSIKNGLLNWRSELLKQKDTSAYYGGEETEKSFSRFGKREEVDDFANDIMKKYKEICKMEFDDSYDLGNKIDQYFTWYLENMIDGLREENKKLEINRLRNFIEKMAVWYELRYPDYEIDRLMDTEMNEEVDIDNIMFYQNPVMRDMLEKHLELGEDGLRDYDQLKWSDFYNIKTFLKSLPRVEFEYLERVKYPENVFFGIRLDYSFHNYGAVASLSLSANGRICDISNNLRCYAGSSVVGMTIPEFIEYSRDKEYVFLDNTLEKVVQKYENRKHSKEEMLNCVMYRIMERGEETYGPIRGYLFAKEFCLNKDIPMVYGADVTCIKEFYSMYLKDGGNVDLMCLDGYYYGSHLRSAMLSVRDLLKDCSYYLEEEDDLHQRLVDVLAIRRQFVERLDKEKIQSNRLQRKLDKARNYGVQKKN